MQRNVQNKELNYSNNNEVLVSLQIKINQGLESELKQSKPQTMPNEVF